MPDTNSTPMKADYLDLSYRNVKLSSGLFTFAFLWIMIMKPLTEGTAFRGLGDLLVGGAVIASGIVSIVGLVYGIRGSQYNQRNPKKRFFGLFGNLCFVLFFVFLILAIVSDMRKIFS